MQPGPYLYIFNPSSPSYVALYVAYARIARHALDGDGACLCGVCVRGVHQCGLEAHVVYVATYLPGVGDLLVK